MKLRSNAIIALPLSLALTLGACSSSSDSKAADTTAEATSADTTPAESVPADAGATPDTIAADATFNAGDVTFAQGMIPHHRQAVEMSRIALDPARKAGTAVKDLATRIQGAQDPEIKLMTGWLADWGQPLDGMGGMSMDGMEGMMTADEMTGLEAATGSGFDKLWLDMMIRHHQGAVKMSKTAQTDGKAAVVKDLAAKIVSAQEGEIAEMKKLLAA